MARGGDRVERFTAGEDLPVDPAVIERELAALWESEAATRACLWNVIAWSEDGKEAGRAKDVLGAVSRNVPMRGIILHSDPHRRLPLRAWISAACHLASGGGKLVCSEQITLSAGREEIRHLPSLLAALAVPDLPVALWWMPGRPWDGEVIPAVRRILDGVDRIIVDSARFDDLAPLSGMMGGAATWGDLEWHRLQPWRAALEGRSGQGITIRHGPDALCRAQLLGGWWRDSRGEEVSLIMEGEGSSLSVTLDGGRDAQVVPQSGEEKGGVPGLIARELLGPWSDVPLRRAVALAPGKLLGMMRITATPDDLHQEMEEALLRVRPVRIALSGGSTPRPLYERLARARLPWERMRIFFADERCVPPDHRDSNYGMVKRTLLDRLEIPPDRVFRMRAEMEDRDEAARLYEASLREEGVGLDLVILGVGADGHTASLFPGDPSLAETERWVVAVDRGRITLTLSCINQAREVWFLVTGEGKADVIRRLAAGEDLPASRVRPEGGRVTWFLDRSSVTATQFALPT
jgi:6-phosphogluconolactonase